MVGWNASTFLLIVSISGALVWVGLCALVAALKKLWAKKQEKAFSPRRTITTFLVTGILGQAMYWVLGITVLDSVAYSKYTDAVSNARTIYNVALEFAEKNPSHGLQTVVAYTGSSYPEGSFEAYAAEFLPEGTYFYAVTFDAKGQPEYTYWSANPLDAAHLQASTREDVSRIVRNPLGDGNGAVGGYSAEADRRIHSRRENTVD